VDWRLTPEAAILSVLLQEAHLWPAVESFNLTVGDFDFPPHGKMYAAALALFKEGRPVDVITLLERDPTIDAGIAANVDAMLADPAHLDSYCESVLDQSVNLRAQYLLRELAETPGRKTLTRLKTFIEENDRFRRGSGVPWGEEIADVVDDILTGAFAASCLKTGIAPLDRVLVGLRPGAVYIIAGRPGMGKTTLGLNIASGMAETGIPAGIVSYEMSRHELILKQLSDYSGINGHLLHSGMIPKDKHKDLEAAEMKLKRSPMHIIDNTASTFEGFSAAAHTLVHKHGCKVVILDYLQLMRGSHHQGREQAVAAISRRIKELARTLNVPIVPLCQLNRKAEGRDDKRPQLSELRESGSLEQDADVVMLLYRPGYYDALASGVSAELIIAKHRQGDTAIVPLLWDGAHSRFVGEGK